MCVCVVQDQLAAPGSLLFKEGMKLEAKDRQNPTMVAVATITSIKDGRLLIHFDGWTTRYGSHTHVWGVFLMEKGENIYLCSCS